LAVSKKGIVITAAIAAGIVATSMLIWLLPQNAPTAVNITDNNDLAAEERANMPADNLSFVYTEHNSIKTEVELALDRWAAGEITADQAKAAIDKVKTDAAQLKNRLQIQPPQEWQESYSLYRQALDKFDQYLQQMEGAVNSGNKDIKNNSQLQSTRQEMDSLVEKSVAAFPARQQLQQKG
jgi:hypothetical protein